MLFKYLLSAHIFTTIYLRLGQAQDHQLLRVKLQTLESKSLALIWPQFYLDYNEYLYIYEYLFK